MGRAILDRQFARIDEHPARSEYHDWRSRDGISTNRVGGAAATEGKPIGAMGLWRRDVHPFSEKQIDLIKTFADQAVIAIENVRLFQELDERNAELREALEHQTATSEVLSIISRSPTDVQAVLTPSSRARPGFVGSMTCCCDSARGAAMVLHGLILVPFPGGRPARSVFDELASIAGCASQRLTLHVPRHPRGKTIFRGLRGSTGQGWCAPF